MTANKYGVSFRKDENVLKLDGDGYTAPGICLKNIKLCVLKGEFCCV